MRKWRVGDICFLNSWPVTYALRQGWTDGPLVLVSATPAELNRRILTGELDASSVSSFLYLRHLEELVPIGGLCIRSDGGVRSVLVVSRQSLATLKGRTIGVSNQGHTTPVLLKILALHQRLKVQLEVTSLRYPEILDEYPAALLIGDEALEASQSAEGLNWWDLGEAWTQWTGLPFVYALWVVRRSLLRHHPEALDEIRQALEASLDWGKAHPSTLISAMRKTFPFEVTFLDGYLRALSYRLDDRAWLGLRRFAREAERIGELPKGTARRLGQIPTACGLEELSYVVR